MKGQEWHSPKLNGKGRVIVNPKQRGGDLTAVQIKAFKMRAQRRALGLPEMRESPVSGWRTSKYAKKGTRKPKHPRVRLRETVVKEAREIQDKARRNATAAMETLVEIASDQSAPENSRIAAALGILDRAYGKPNQTNTNVNVDANGKPHEVSGTELDNRINEALRAVEDLTGRARKASKGKKQPVDLRERHRNPDGSEPSVN